MIRDPEACIGPFFWSCWVSLKMAAGPRGMLAEMPAPVCSLIVADLYDQEPRPDDPSCGLASWSSGPSWSKHFLTLQMQAPLSHYKSVTKVQVKILSFSPRNFFFGRHQPTLLSTQNQVYADHAVPFHYCAAQTDAAQKTSHWYPPLCPPWPEQVMDTMKAMTAVLTLNTPSVVTLSTIMMWQMMLCNVWLLYPSVIL